MFHRPREKDEPKASPLRIASRPVSLNAAPSTESGRNGSWGGCQRQGLLDCRSHNRTRAGPEVAVVSTCFWLIESVVTNDPADPSTGLGWCATGSRVRASHTRIAPESDAEAKRAPSDE